MSDDFEFDEGDTVLVRVRERGTSGKLQAKFVAEVVDFGGSIGPGSEYATLDPPWKSIGYIKLHSYEAEFEVVNDDEGHF
jgi:hypothetical protein